MNKIRNKKGFTLTELLISILIFSFMAMTLSTVYATANRFFFQSFREDLWKNRLTLTMKFIKNKLVTASDIETPSLGSETNILAFYSNYLKMPPGTVAYPGTGCAPTNAVASMWHYFCLSGDSLYYHTGTIASPSVCPTIATTPNWIGTIICGQAGGNITLLSQNIYVPAARTSLFGRVGLPRNTVRVSVMLWWKTTQVRDATYNYKTSREIINTDEMYVSVNRPSQW